MFALFLTAFRSEEALLLKPRMRAYKQKSDPPPPTHTTTQQPPTHSTRPPKIRAPENRAHHERLPRHQNAHHLHRKLRRPAEKGTSPGGARARVRRRARPAVAAAEEADGGSRRGVEGRDGEPPRRARADGPAPAARAGGRRIRAAARRVRARAGHGLLRGFTRHSGRRAASVARAR